MFVDFVPSATKNELFLLVFEIQKLGIPCEFLAAKLKKGFGDEVCHILYSILVLALEKLNFKFLPPIIPKQLQFVVGIA